LRMEKREENGYCRFADGCKRQTVLRAIQKRDSEELDFDVVMCVDWHAVAAWRGMCQSNKRFAETPWVFLCYRIFARDQYCDEVRKTLNLQYTLLGTCTHCSSPNS
jgi:hypothetical protein